MSKLNIIPIFVPHLGCPNDCKFCNQTKITGTSTNVDVGFVESTINEHLGNFKNKTNVKIAFYGGSFTAIDRNIMESLLQVAYKYKSMGVVKSIRLSTRPDCIDESKLEILKKYQVDTIELGVQSLDFEVLKASNRGHGVECVYNSSKMIKEYGFNLGLQQMVGLPGDTLEKSLYTANEFIKLDPYCVRIYPTLVIVGTELEKEYLEGKYSPLSLERSVEIVAELLKLYYKNNINVIRVGLQPTENINYGGDLVAGPFHPAYRSLVEEKIFLDFLDSYYKNSSVKDSKIFASNRNISYIVGQKGKNRKYIWHRYGVNLSLIGENLDSTTLIIDGKTIDLREYW